MTRSIDSWLTNHRIHTPDKVALRCEGRAWSYAELDAWVRGLASGLVETYGLRRGDRVAFLGRNSAPEVALFFAAARLGLIVVPLNWRLTSEELAFVTENAGARVLVYGAGEEGLATSVAERAGVALCREDQLPKGDLPIEPAALTDPFLIVYTSGTTGRPKGAVHTQEAVLWNALTSIHAHEFTPNDHVLNVLPLFHVGGINIQMMPIFLIGGTVTLHPGFDPTQVIQALTSEEVTSTVCVPAMMQALMAMPGWDNAQFPSLRLLNTGSTDVPVEILKAVNARGIPMVQVYGATETGPVSTYQRASEALSTIGSIGRPGAHVQVRIVGPDGQDCATDVPGEIWVKAPNNFSHYWRDPKATAAAVEDGWFKTGDIARRDAGGLLWFAGRSKHVIISGGENIYPAEIERLLAPIQGLTEVAVVGRPDGRWGEVPVVVCVVSDDGPTASDIHLACAPIAKFKRPKDIVFVDALPRNALGKVIIEDTRQLAINAAASESLDQRGKLNAT